MKTFEDDKELRQLLKNIQLDKPSPDFTSSVMNRVFLEQTRMEQVKSEPVLGKTFWILVALFGVLLIAALMIPESSNESTVGSFLSQVNNNSIFAGYRSLLSNLGNVPAYIAGIFIALSMLVFIDRFFTLKDPDAVL